LLDLYPVAASAEQMQPTRPIAIGVADGELIFGVGEERRPSVCDHDFAGRDLDEPVRRASD
jgi:hypothetical protein